MTSFPRGCVTISEDISGCQGTILICSAWKPGILPSMLESKGRAPIQRTVPPRKLTVLSVMWLASTNQPPLSLSPFLLPSSLPLSLLFPAFTSSLSPSFLSSVAHFLSLPIFQMRESSRVSRGLHTIWMQTSKIVMVNTKQADGLMGCAALKG